MLAPDISAERRELCESQAALRFGVCTGIGSGGEVGLRFTYLHRVILVYIVHAPGLSLASGVRVTGIPPTRI